MISKKIRQQHGDSEEGWGRLRTTAEIGESKWNTSIWFDTKTGVYLLPVKVAVRKQEKIQVDDHLAVRLSIEDEDPKKAKWLRPF